MPDLKRYRAKRDPDATPEPFGEGFAAPRLVVPAPRFVVQQHAARRMHYDLRLEIEGVLVSFAVPRGPSLDPAERRLAVRTEDHPLEYRDFEGIIPEGNYGAGAMIVWDSGLYRSLEGAPASALAAGKLDLVLDGHKLHGRFALVRTRRGEGKEWLLIRKGAPHAGPDLTEAQPASVLSGLRVDEVARGVSRDVPLTELAARIGQAMAGADALRELEPMLATRGERPFSQEGWLFELKYDGVRVIASKGPRGPYLRARSGRDVTDIYPEISAALRHLPAEAFVLDGEVVALDERGRSSFERIQRRFTQTDPGGVAQAAAQVPCVFYAFDLLSFGRFDLRSAPLLERKRALAELVPALGVVRFTDHVEADGKALFDAAAAHGLEGMIAKRADSTYTAGERSRDWQKIKVPRSAKLVIVGISAGQGSRRSLGSLMVAGLAQGVVRYAGNVGSGLDDAAIGELLAFADANELAAPAFENAPETSRPPRWLRPVLACEVRYTELTTAGLLRQPVFVRLLRDVKLEECELPAPLSPELPAEPACADAAAREPAPSLPLTRLDKVFWPVEGYTKGDLLAYYEAIWPFIAPYLRDRPVVLTRYPDGVEGKSFYQKNAPEWTPGWVKRERIDDTDYFICDDLRTLLYVVNSGAIPLHVWSARLASIERPDWLILDLDPKEAPFEHVVLVARHIHALLGDLGASHFAKTSGQDGLHVLVPLGGALGHDEAKALGEVLARTVCSELPEIATVVRPVAARADKVYVDFLQNGRGKLIAAPFSVRPRAGAPVSMPLRWSQVQKRLDPARFHLRNAVERMSKHGDPLAPVLEQPVDVAALLEELSRRLEVASRGVPAGG